MRLARHSVATGLALAAALFLAGSASAHSLVQSSVPAAGATLASPPTMVTITFGEEPDSKLSSIKVLDKRGAVVSTGAATVVAGDALKLSVALRPLGAGVYTVAWRTVSAVDGHSATGSFAFGVDASPPTPAAGSAMTAGAAPPPGGADAPSTLAIAGRWLLFLGLVGLLGVAAFGLLVATPAAGVTRRFVPLAWLVAAAGTVGVVAAQLADSGTGLGDVMGSSFGSAISERSIPLLVAGFGVIGGWRRDGARATLVIIAAGAAGALVADVLLSHAAAGAGAAVAIAVQGLHVVAVGLWLGGLAGLLIAVRRPPSETTARAARRFSWLATAGIATVAVTGLVRAVAEIGTLERLVGTDFGRLVVAKTGLLAVLAALGAVNHFRNVPAAGRSLAGLRRVGSVELLVGATIILLSATLVNLAPPVEVAAAGATSVAEPAAAGPSPGAPPTPGPTPAPLVADGSDFGTSVRLHLVVTRGTAGAHTFTATVTDYDSGAAVPATGVALRFTPPRSDVGSSRLDLVPVGPGVFAATGTNLSLDGMWHITAVVANGAASVEVPLMLETAGAAAASSAPAPTIDVNAVPGLPTIYSVHLDAGRTVQVYLDPGTAGANEVHATFFDAAGTELPVTSVAMGLGPVGGALVPLTPRQLEPGHFVADTTLVVGTYHLTVSGPAPTGDQLSTGLDIPVSK